MMTFYVTDTQTHFTNVRISVTRRDSSKNPQKTDFSFEQMPMQYFRCQWRENEVMCFCWCANSRGDAS